MAKPVILCVDDEQIILTSLKHQLYHGLGDNIRVELAESGEEALEVLEELAEDDIEVPLIISDQIMGGMNGDELLAKVKKRYPDTLSILLTGQATTDAIGKAVNYAGLYRYFAKPWDEEDLVITVEQALTSYNHQQELFCQHEQNRVLNHITRLALNKRPLNELLNAALEILLSAELCDFKSGGTIELYDKQSEDFSVVAASPEDKNNERAREESKVYHNELQMLPDGFFYLPLVLDTAMLGVVYVKLSKKWKNSTQSKLFLSSVAQTITGIIRLSRYHEAIQEQNSYLEECVRDRTNELHAALRKQEQLNDILLSANKQLDLLATTDDLTGLLNRRSFFDRANQEVMNGQRENQPTTVMVLDIDYFKSVNDKQGHHVGDQVLVHLSETLKSLVRKQDVAGRFGGDEFAIILPETTLVEGEVLAERIREETAETVIELEKSSVDLSVSIGLTLVAEGENSVYQAMIRADKALYQSKNKGRNQVSRL